MAIELTLEKFYQFLPSAPQPYITSWNSASAAARKSRGLSQHSNRILTPTPRYTFHCIPICNFFPCFIVSVYVLSFSSSTCSCAQSQDAHICRHILWNICFRRVTTAQGHAAAWTNFPPLPSIGLCVCVTSLHINARRCLGSCWPCS